MYLKIFLLVISLQEFYASSNKVVTEKGGFCLLTWTSRMSSLEPYSYTKMVRTQERCGWRTCERNRVQTTTDTRIVFRDVNNTQLECCEGYQKKSIHGEHFDCVPICDPPCECGHCLAPGNCTCSHGYRHATANLCVPSCEPECINGKCISPGTCECNAGYFQVNDSYCAPNCSSPCVNGLCVKPNECLCNSGFEKSQTDPFLCNPMCLQDCINATCENINECVCLKGHFKANKLQPNVCSPFCNLECINGDCTAPDICTCKQGYHLVNTSRNVCIPDCNCTYGFCIEPNVCVCYENYTLHDGDCIPVCDNCINSTCTSPHTCECLDGFKKLNDTVCIPRCSNCVNGLCTEPEVCSCLPGYRNNEAYGEDTCEPVCDSGCANGICSAPNNCSCAEEIEKIDENICFPVCGSINSTSPEDDCLTTEKTSIFIGQDLFERSSLLRLHLKVNCTELYRDKNLTCDFDSCSKSNCSGIHLECTAVKNIKNKFKLICLWEETSHYGNISYSTYNSIYEDAITDVFYDGNLNESVNHNKEVAMTVLFPKFLTVKGANCELCSCSSDFRWTDDNKLNFQLFPCPPGEKEELQKPRDYMMYIVIAGLAAGIIVLLTSLFVIFNRGKLHEYLVTAKYEKRMSNDIYDEPMITEETEN